MACAVRSCRNEIYRRPDLSFFTLPRQHHLKDEWLEVLGIERGENIGNIKVCEIHFKPKDFCTGKKQLKTHAVPVLKLGRGTSEPVDSEDEFMEYNSDGDPEIVELPVKKATTESPSVKIKQEETDIKVSVQQETEPEGIKLDTEEGRRPSRRAAREAAKKIYNTVRSYMPKADETFARAPNTATSSPAQFQQRQRKRTSTKVLPISLDLVMECHEEILSPVQAEALLKAQLEYNMVMKTLRSLKASNVKIIVSKEPFSVASQSPVTTPNVSSKTGSNTFSVVSNSTSVNSQKPSVVPMILSSSSLQISQPSPAVA